jgi:hypothetical protein
VGQRRSRPATTSTSATGSLSRSMAMCRTSECARSCSTATSSWRRRRPPR